MFNNKKPDDLKLGISYHFNGISKNRLQLIVKDGHGCFERKKIQSEMSIKTPEL